MDFMNTNEARMAFSFWTQLFIDAGWPVDVDDQPREILWSRPLPLVASVFPFLICVLTLAYHPLLIQPEPSRLEILLCLLVGLFPVIWGAQGSGSAVFEFALSTITSVVGLRMVRLSFFRRRTRRSRLDMWTELISLPLPDQTTHSQAQAPSSARRQNAIQAMQALPQAVLVPTLLRCIPPPESLIHMSFIQARLYHMLAGLAILFVLQGSVQLCLSSWGIVMNSRQKPMFRNPLGARTLQELWGQRWNRVVQEQLHFLFACLAGNKVKGGRRRRTLAALATFLLSGLFHEYLAYQSFGTASFQQFWFFMIQGVLCSMEPYIPKGATYAWLVRVSWVLMCEMYTGAWLQSHFFEQAKAFLPGPIRVDSMVWLFGRPAT